MPHSPFGFAAQRAQDRAVAPVSTTLPPSAFGRLLPVADRRREGRYGPADVVACGLDAHDLHTRTTVVVDHGAISQRDPDVPEVGRVVEDPRAPWGVGARVCRRMKRASCLLRGLVAMNRGMRAARVAVANEPQAVVVPCMRPQSAHGPVDRRLYT